MVEAIEDRMVRFGRILYGLHDEIIMADCLDPQLSLEYAKMLITYNYQHAIAAVEVARRDENFAELLIARYARKCIVEAGDKCHDGDNSGMKALIMEWAGIKISEADDLPPGPQATRLRKIAESFELIASLLP